MAHVLMETNARVHIEQSTARSPLPADRVFQRAVSSNASIVSVAADHSE
jgi:hypothetical protein